MKPTRSLAACAVAGILLLAGCGGTDGPDAAVSSPTTSTSVSPTSSAGSSIPSGAAGSSSSGSGESGDAPAVGDAVTVASFVKDLRDGAKKSETSHARVSMSILGQEILTEGDFDGSGSTPEAVMHMTLPDAGETEIRLVDGALYMRIAKMTKNKFVKIDLDTLPTQVASSLGAIDPREQVDQFVSAIRAVKFLGTTKRDGVELDRYRVRMDSTKVQGLAGGATLPKNITMDLYLDDENRMAGMQMEVPVQGKSFFMDGTFSQFGKDVVVQKPPASQLMTTPQ